MKIQQHQLLCNVASFQLETFAEQSVNPVMFLPVVMYKNLNWLPA